MWRGAEHNDRRGISISKLKREIGEKKRGKFACFDGNVAKASAGCF